MLWLYLHFPTLQLDTLLSQYDEASLDNSDKEKAVGAAVVVLDTQKNRICQCNEHAKAQHIELGMGLGTASSLCHEINIHDYQEHIEQQRLYELAQWLYLFTGDIALFEPKGLVLEVSSMLKLYENLSGYLRRIDELLRQQSVSVVKALAYSPVAARALARAGQEQLSDDKSHIQYCLDNLPIGALELPSKMQEQLRRIGLSSFGELRQLPRKELGARFGIELLHYLEQMQGETAVPLVFFQPPPHFEQNLVLHHEVTQASAIQFPLKILLQKVQSYLQERALLTHALKLTLIHRDDKSTDIEILSAEPEYQSQIWLNLSQLKIENMALESPVIEIKLTTNELIEQSAQHQDLFVAQQGELTPKQLISRIQAKVGEQNIHGFNLHEDYRPEHAFSARALSNKKSNQGNNSKGNTNSPKHSQTKVSKTNTSMPSHRWLRPSLLYKEPQPLSQSIRIVHGPERIQGSWWTESAICRDYFVAHATAADQSQQTLWVFRDQDNQWFVHGLFA